MPCQDRGLEARLGCLLGQLSSRIRNFVSCYVGQRNSQFSSVTFASRMDPNFARISRNLPQPKFRKTMRETLAQGKRLGRRRYNTIVVSRVLSQSVLTVLQRERAKRMRWALVPSVEAGGGGEQTEHGLNRPLSTTTVRGPLRLRNLRSYHPFSAPRLPGIRVRVGIRRKKTQNKYTQKRVLRSGTRPAPIVHKYARPRCVIANGDGGCATQGERA